MSWVVGMVTEEKLIDLLFKLVSRRCHEFLSAINVYGKSSCVICWYDLRCDLAYCVDQMALWIAIVWCKRKVIFICTMQGKRVYLFLDLYSYWFYRLCLEFLYKKLSLYVLCWSNGHMIWIRLMQLPFVR